MLFIVDQVDLSLPKGTRVTVIMFSYLNYATINVFKSSIFLKPDLKSK